MKNDFAVQLRNVTKKIGNKRIIDNLSLDILPGEVFGLLGPNGAGKTTTIRMMVGLMAMTDGEIFIHNKSIARDFKGAIASVGAIVENPELYGFLSGYGNLKHFANMVPGIGKDRIMEVARVVGLEDRIHDKVKKYSLGMRQRLGLAQAILHKPSVLILDEPSNGLDPAGIREMREYLRGLAIKDNTAVIVSSHLMAEMEMMCDRIAVIQDGKLIDVKEKSDFIHQDEGESWFSFKIDKPEKAKVQLREEFSDLEILQKDGVLKVKALAETVAGINVWLVKKGYLVYTITQEVKTLEDRFLEVTGGRK